MLNGARRLGFTLLVMGIVAGAGERASAGQIAGLGSPTDAIPGGVVVDFNSEMNGTPQGYTSGDITIVGIDGILRFSNEYAGLYNTQGSYLENNSGRTDTVGFYFAATVDRFAFNFGASDVVFNLSAYDSNGILIEAYDLPTTGSSNNGEYFGIGASGIRSAILTTTTNDQIFLDNFTYSLQAEAVAAPEPSTLAGAGVGLALAVVAVIKRRRKVA